MTRHDPADDPPPRRLRSLDEMPPRREGDGYVLPRRPWTPWRVLWAVLLGIVLAPLALAVGIGLLFVVAGMVG